MPRLFGPQDEDDLIDQIQYVQLQKILPVLNGLLYENIGNCQQILNDRGGIGLHSREYHQSTGVLSPTLLVYVAILHKL